MMKRLYILIITGLCLLGASPAQAQLQDQRSNLSIGVNGGVNFSSISITPSFKQGKQVGPAFGLTVRYIGEKYFKMICGIQGEVNFSQRGWKEVIEDGTGDTYHRSMSYIEIPLLAHLAFGKESHGMQFFLNAGPQIGFFLNESHTQSGPWEDYSGFTVEQHDMPVENKFDYGITAGVGVELRTKVGHFQVEGRYYYALSDFYHSTKKDYFARSAHGVIGIKMAYLFDITK